MKPSKLAAALTVAAMIIGASLNAQVIDQKNITLDAAKKIVSEAVKYAQEHNAPGGSIAVVDNGAILFTWKD